MTADAAVRVALLRSPRLQQEYARLGLARADVLEAVQVSNPTLSLSRSYLDPGSGYNRLAGLTLPLADLLVLPVRTRLAHAEYERAKLEIAGAVLSVAADVEAAWYTYVGAQQVADMRTAVAGGADAAAELAQRFFDAGNISELQLKQEQAAASEARINAARARADAGRARLALNTLLGLSGKDAAWATSDRLPMPVATEDDPLQLAELARSSNLELLAARQQAGILVDALGITRKLRWLGGSEIGYEREREADGVRLRGPTLDLELPIFNQGQAKLARAEALLAEARARLAQAELGVDNSVRLGAEQVRELSQVVAIHRDALIPQREKVVERSQQEQNFMLIGVFELIQAKVQEYNAYESYLEAVRDYWLARVELMRAVGQRLPSDASVGDRTPSVQDILTPPADEAMPGMDHSGHDMSSMPARSGEAESMTTLEHTGHAMPPEPATPADPEHAMEGKDHSGHDMSTMPAAPSPPVEEVSGSEREGTDTRTPPPAAGSIPVDHSEHSPAPTSAPAAPTENAEDEDDQTPTQNDHSAHGDTP
jgi:outer membrane protein TolC